MSNKKLSFEGKLRNIISSSSNMIFLIEEKRLSYQERNMAKSTDIDFSKFVFDEKKEILNLEFTKKVSVLINHFFFVFENELFCIKKKKDIWTKKKGPEKSNKHSMHIEKVTRESFNISDKHLINYCYEGDEEFEKIKNLSENFYNESYSRSLEDSLSSIISFENFKKEDIIKNKGKHLIYKDNCPKLEEMSNISKNIHEKYSENLLISPLNAGKVFKMMGLSEKRKYVNPRLIGSLYEIDFITDSLEILEYFSIDLVEEFKDNYLNRLRIEILNQKKIYSFIFKNFSENLNGNLNRLLLLEHNLWKISSFCSDDVARMINHFEEHSGYIKKIFNYNGVSSSKFTYDFLRAALIYEVIYGKFSVSEVKDVHIFTRKMKYELNNYIIENIGKDKEKDKLIHKIIRSS